MFAAKFEFTCTPNDIEGSLNAFFERFPNVEYVIGGRYASDFLEKYADELKPSPLAWLDARSKGRHVLLREDSGHNSWVNSRAMAALGITKDFVDPKGGQIVRDAVTGEPTGILLEESDVAARLAWPDWSAEQYRLGVLEMLKIANGFGITGINDADVNAGIIRAFKEVDSDGLGLSLRIAASMTTPYGHREIPLNYLHYENWRDTYASKRVDTTFVKIYLDGVGLSDSKSAAMLHPYQHDPRFPAEHCGSVHVGHEILSKDITELDKRGFTVKIHCCGDASVRACLDAIEVARKTNGSTEYRHELAHAGCVDAADIPRFAKLNAVADLSPYLWFVFSARHSTNSILTSSSSASEQAPFSDCVQHEKSHWRPRRPLFPSKGHDRRQSPHARRLRLASRCRLDEPLDRARGDGYPA
jgi:predicted amidohydrolase YtcJ